MEFKGEVHNENVKVFIKVFVTNYQEVLCKQGGAAVSQTMS
jgi:hypothetical protein